MKVLLMDLDIYLTSLSLLNEFARLKKQTHNILYIYQSSLLTYFERKFYLIQVERGMQAHIQDTFHL